MAVVASDVQNVLNTSASETIINAMLDTAERIIVDHLDSAATIAADTRDQIKTWLAAHFTAVYDRQEKEYSADGVRFLFDGKTEMGLRATLWGQQAILLDPTGILGRIDSPNRRKLNTFISNDQTDNV